MGDANDPNANTDPVAAPADDAAAAPPDDAAAPPPEDAAAPPPEDAVAPPDDAAAASPPDDAAAPPPDDAAVPPPDEIAAPPPAEPPTTPKAKKPCPCKRGQIAGAAAPADVPPGESQPDSVQPTEGTTQPDASDQPAAAATQPIGGAFDDMFINPNVKAYQELAAEAGTHLEHLCYLDYKSKPHPIRRTGIICTIGPASQDPDMLVKLFERGMNVARLNFSHGTHEYHTQTIVNVRQAVEMYSAKIGRKFAVAIALDTKGPEIRTGLLEGDTGRKEVELITGNPIEVTTDSQWESSGTADKIYVDYSNIVNVIQPGNRIFIDDGLMSLVANSINGNTISCIVENGGLLGSRKGVNLPGSPVDLPAISEKDKADLEFGVQQGVDIVFASFIRTPGAVDEIRNILGPDGKNILIISKIESTQGMDNINEIIETSDGIMLARGDLGIEIPTQKVFIAQKTIIARCNRIGKTVICATQMLESMTKKPRPTRAESSDVANAVLDGADCVMLSGESAKGLYPLECVTVMSNICREAEAVAYQKEYYHDICDLLKLPLSVQEATALAAVEASIKTLAQAIIVLTNSGKTSHLVSKYRPRCPILTITRNEQVGRQLCMHRGCIALLYDGAENPDPVKDNEDRLLYAVDVGKKEMVFQNGDVAIALLGQRTDTGGTNRIKILTIADDMESSIRS